MSDLRKISQLNLNDFFWNFQFQSLLNLKFILRLFLTALLITGVCAGTKFQTAEDFEAARNEAASGKDLSKQIYKEYKKIPPEFRLEAVELAASSNSKKAKKYLRKILEKYEEDPPEVKSRIAFHLFRMEDEKSYPLIMNLIRSEKVLVDDSIAEFLVKDKKPENAEILFHALQNEKISYTPELAAFFGMVKYISAIPYLIEALDKKQLPAETIEALSAMKEEGGEAVAEKIFSILSDHSHPYRKHALKNLKGFPEDRVRSVVMDILKHREGESEGVVLLALEVSADLEYEKKLMSQIKETYVYENRAPVKNAALQAAVKVLGVSEEEFLNEIHMPLAEHQSRMAFLHSGGSDEDDTFLLESEMPDITEEGTLTENNEKDKKKEAEIASDQDQAEAADDDESLDVDSLIKEMMEEDENAENIPDASESKMGDASVSECDCKTLEETVDAQKKEIASKKSEIEKLKKKKSYTGKKPAKKAKPKYKKTKPVKKTVKKEKKGSELKTDPSKKTEKKQSRAREKLEPPPLPDSLYARKLHSSMDSYFGREQGKYIRSKINRALISYSYRNDKESSLILRIYERKYRASVPTLRGFMRRGLDHTGTLGALVNGFRTEFESKELQIFAFAEYFALKRWQASALFEMSDKRGL